MRAEALVDTNILVYAVEGLDTLFSEDLNEGQGYGGVVAINPFARRTRAV